MLRNTFARTAERCEAPECRGAPSATAQPSCKIAGGLAVAHETNDPRVRHEMRHETLEWRSMKPETDNGFEPPAEPRGGVREGRWCGVRNPFTGRQLLGEARAGAMPERIAGSQHRRRPAAAAQHDVSIERHRPGAAAVADICEREMTVAAEHGFRASQRLSTCIGQPGKAIFADTDDGQPGINHDARPYSGRNCRCEPARRRDRARGD